MTGPSSESAPKPKPRKNLSSRSRSGSASLGNILAVNPDQFLINDNGDVFVDKNDRQYISKTHVSYRNGARKIMGELTKYYDKEIHYDDYLAFGEPTFLRCKNIIQELGNMPSGKLLVK